MTDTFNNKKRDHGHYSPFLTNIFHKAAKGPTLPDNLSSN